jgi:hypothetical protein
MQSLPFHRVCMHSVSTDLPQLFSRAMPEHIPHFLLEYVLALSPLSDFRLHSLSPLRCAPISERRSINLRPRTREREEAL